MSYKDFFMRKLKIALIKKYIKYPVTVIGQTQTICGRLQRYYGLNNVETVPSAVSLDNLSMTGHFDFQLPADKFKLLYLSTYSVHKNMEILIPLAKKIKDQYLPYLIIVTVNPAQHRRAEEFLKKIEHEKLESVILNLGHIEMKNVASLYNQSNALLMPTLLESYGLPFVEAMYHQKSILTSDLDFARDVCGEAAFYFDPLDENSIIQAINDAYSNSEHRLLKIKEGEERIKRLLSWQQVFDRYQELLELNISKAGKKI
jgi:glycosyltransferase involved in cell wall biosynthesis